MRREEFVPFYVHGFFKVYLKLSGSRVQDFKAIWYLNDWQVSELCRCLKLVVNSVASYFWAMYKCGTIFVWCFLHPARRGPFSVIWWDVRAPAHIAYRTGTILLHFSGEQKAGVKYETCTTCLSPSCVSHASRQVHACLHWPKKSEKIMPFLQATAHMVGLLFPYSNRVWPLAATKSCSAKVIIALLMLSTLGSFLIMPLSDFITAY